MAGRKTKYDTHIEPYLALIKSLRIEGKTEKQICEVLEIHWETLDRYRKSRSELYEALKISKATLIAKLEQTLFEKALEGNPTLLIFSLKNLAPSKWADVYKNEVEGKVIIPQIINDAPTNN